jgi:UDP-GlcNAc:undecaprenyl-phosphate/decaprenyl-phosphate GlcNAc-1-phosphate transferase
MREYLFILIIAAAVTYLLTPLVRQGAIAMHAQHAARSRDVHKEPTPLLGGLAMYGGLVAGLLVAEQLSYLRQAFPSARTVGGLLLAGGLLVAVGIVDDRWGLGAVSKLAGQIAAGGIVAWSGAYLSWIPWPGSEKVLLEPDLAYTLTILIIVATINAVNFIDGLDGLAAGVVGISAVAYLVYSYNLTNSVGIPSQSVPAVVSAVVAGMCLGFLPHNFNPARIFMGDTGAMLLGLLLAYGPIESTATLDQNILVTYSNGASPLDRFPTILPLLIPVAIWLIPYTDMVLAVIRRTAKGMSPFDADREHLHHRLLNMGHSHRQSVLLMYLWAALFSGLVVGLSVLRISMIWFALITLAAFAALLLATAPKLRWWRGGNGKRARAGGSRMRVAGPFPVTSGLAAPARGPATGALPSPVLPTANGSRPVNASPAANSGPPVNGGQPANGRPAVNGRPAQEPASGTGPGSAPVPPWPGRR